jgi:type IV pilus modification protein PilV
VNGTRANAGFSLLEIMCAILILGIGLVGLTQGIAAALRASKESEIQTTAAMLAAGQIESLRADGFVIEGETEGEGEGALSNYTWRQTVTTTRIDGLYEVSVVIENATSGKLIYELQTLLFDPPVTSTSDETEGRGNDRRRERARR